MDKRLIAERFAKARDTYGQEARVQQQVADKMLQLLRQTAERECAGFSHMAEFGCGTGYYSRLLLQAFHPQRLLLNDLCDEMGPCVQELCKDGVRFLPHDAETLDFPSDTQLITSCSTLQWFAQPARFFQRCHRFLTPGGLLAFSTFGPHNLCEIRALTGNGLAYPTLAELTEMLAPHFRLLHQEEEQVTLTFPDPIQVLRHLKLTGVTGTEKRIWTRQRLHDFSEAYIRQFGHADTGGVTLTYHPIYIIAKNR